MASENVNILRSEVDWYFGQPQVTDITAPDFILRNVNEHVKSGKTLCFTNGNDGESCNYKDVEPMSRKIASSLFNKGFVKGDTVITSSHGDAKLHIFFLGVWRANGIIRSSYMEDAKGELLNRIVESEARWILCDEGTQDANKETAAKAPWPVTVIVMGEASGFLTVNELLLDNGDKMPSRLIGRDDIAFILATSGTTGVSKGAVYTHANLLNTLLFYKNFPYSDNQNEPLLLTSRTTHASGTIIPLSCSCAGQHIVHLPDNTFVNILEAIKKYKVYTIMTLPINLIRMTSDPLAKSYDLSSLHSVHVFGQTTDVTTVEAIKKLPNVKHFGDIYGMTEAAGFTSSLDFHAAKIGIMKSYSELRPFKVGKLLPGVKLKVVDYETGEILGVGQRGELTFQTVLISSGYFKRPKETANAFKDGWIHTGDIGYYDEDGWVYLVDRFKETFKYFNNHICPSELQNILLQHPAVAQACVVGVPAEDGGDTVPRALVVLKESATAKAQDIRDALNEQVATYKQLRGGLYIVSAIPLGKTGKVDRRLAAEMKLTQ